MGTHTRKERDAETRPSIKAERVSTYVYYLHYNNILLYVGFQAPVGPGLVDRQRNNNTEYHRHGVIILYLPMMLCTRAVFNIVIIYF